MVYVRVYLLQKELLMWVFLHMKGDVHFFSLMALQEISRRRPSHKVASIKQRYLAHVQCAGDNSNLLLPIYIFLLNLSVIRILS
jgi:hypothetical protein